MRTLLIAALIVAANAHLGAQQPTGVRVARGGDLPPGWTVRLDRPTDNLEELAFSCMGQGLHVTSGPAAIFYNPENVKRGNYTVEAEFTQMRAPRHPEAFGLFIGGNELETPNQRYTYFLVRGDGRYMIRHRAGAETHDIAGWTEHEAVRRQGEDGRMTNRMAIVVGDNDVSFRVNGTEVARHTRAQLQDVEGQAGLRINHNLDVHVEGFAAR